MDLAGTGWQRALGGLALHFALLLVHETAIGVGLMPG